MKRREPTSISAIRMVVRVLRNDPFVKAQNLTLADAAAHLADLETFRRECFR